MRASLRLFQNETARLSAMPQDKPQLKISKNHCVIARSIRVRQTTAKFALRL
jgi:hypothetical protein